MKRFVMFVMVIVFVLSPVTVFAATPIVGVQQEVTADQTPEAQDTPPDIDWCRVIGGWDGGALFCHIMYIAWVNTFRITGPEPTPTPTPLPFPSPTPVPTPTEEIYESFSSRGSDIEELNNEEDCEGILEDRRCKISVLFPDITKEKCPAPFLISVVYYFDNTEASFDIAEIAKTDDEGRVWLKFFPMDTYPNYLDQSRYEATAQCFKQ